MDESTDFGSDTGSYESTAGDITTTYEPGYQSTESYDAYQDQSDAANDLYQASTQAELAGDSYGSAMLNDASIAESAQSDQSWDQYMGEGDSSPTFSTAEDASSIDTAADSSGIDDNLQSFDDYLSS